MAETQKKPRAFDDDDDDDDIEDYLRSRSMMMSLQSHKRKYRIVLLGAERTGKTAYFRQFARGDFEVGPYFPTTQENRLSHEDFAVDCSLDTVDLIISDFGPKHPDYKSLLVRNIRGADGFIIFFDVKNRATFEAVDCFATLVDENNDIRRTAIVLAGLQLTDGGEAQVSPAEVTRWVDWWRDNKSRHVAYFPYSAAHGGLNVEQVMTSVLQGVLTSEKTKGSKQASRTSEQTSRSSEQASRTSEQASKTKVSYKSKPSLVCVNNRLVD